MGRERVEQSRALDNDLGQGPTMTGITLQAWIEGQTEAVDSKGSSDIVFLTHCSKAVRADSGQ